MKFREFVYAPAQTFRCMAFHRNLKMIHVQNGDHLVVCKTCAGKNYQDVKHTLLTFLYFHQGLPTLIIMLPIMVAGALHQAITGHEGSFEHPPEHRKKAWHPLDPRSSAESHEGHTLH